MATLHKQKTYCHSAKNHLFLVYFLSAMETATLRIRFQPLLQEVNKGESNCCLEIVPQVTAAHDIERIRWALDKDLVEYTVPMNYKIIIRKEKKRKLQVNSDSSTNVYHSCVDLLHSYSLISNDAECGDVVQRIISDNFFLRRFTSSTDHFRNYKADKKKRQNGKRTSSSGVQHLAQDASVLCHLTPITLRQEAKKDVNELLTTLCVNKVEDNNKELVGDANTLPALIYSLRADGNILPEDNRNISDYSLKMSVSAVYPFDTSNLTDLMESVDSYAEGFSKENVTEINDVGTFQRNDESIESGIPDAIKLGDQNITRTLIFDATTSPMAIFNKRKNKSSRYLNIEDIINKDEGKISELKTNLSKHKTKSSGVFQISYSDNTNKKSVSRFLSNGFDIFDQLKPKNISVNEENIISYIETERPSLIYRPSVESRVAKFIELMEKEILPLKFEFNDVINKCVSLGILSHSQEKSLQRNDTLLLYKNVINPNQTEILQIIKKRNHKLCDTRKTKYLKTNTNRGVYSIVYNE